MKSKFLFYPKSIFRLTLTALLVVSVFSGLPQPALAQTSQNYIIKLFQDDTTLLNQIGEDVTHRLSFTDNSDFSNVYSFSSNLSLVELQGQLAGSFEYLEPDKKLAIKIDGQLSDPGFTQDTTQTDKQWALPKAQFTSGWNKTKGSNNVVVAIIDTGIDSSHEDLRNQTFVRGYNISTRTPIVPGTNSDDNGHGTLVAGIIGAVPDNSLGIAGGVWKVSLMPIKALDANGAGSSLDISEAIVWAADNGASVINMSVGGMGFGHDTTLANAISYAFEKNVVIVAAAGNDVAITGGNLDVEPVFPVCDDNGKNMVIGVTATDNKDVKPNFANFGKACVDVSAPGRRILSTINHDPITRASVPNSYAFASGTSMAVPYVSAQAVLLKSLYPNATNTQIRDRIIGTAENIDNLNLSQCGGQSCRGLLGSGRINVFQSLQQEILPPISEGDVVQSVNNSQLYYINGAKRHAIFPFVKNQRFPNVVPKQVSEQDLAKFPEGSYAEPLDGTLVKSNSSSTVYFMSKGLRFPVTGQVFNLYKFSFSDVKTLSQAEVDSWITASFLVPPDGSLIRTPGNKTVYWVVGGSLHPINYNFYINRGLNIFPVIYVQDLDIKSFSQGESYIL